MSISMSMVIRWNFALNTSGFEWSDLQYPIEKICAKTYIYTIRSKFKKVCDFTFKDVELELYARADDTHDIEFIVLKKIIEEVVNDEQ